MVWDNSFGVGNIISLLGFTVASVGLFLNWMQLRKSNVRERAALVDKLFFQYLNDPDATSMFYDIIYGRFKYNPVTFYGSPDEIKLDKLLTYFGKIARIYKMKVLKKEDLELVKFEFVSLNASEVVISYLDNLARLAQSQNIKELEFASFQEVANELGGKNLHNDLPANNPQT